MQKPNSQKEYTSLGENYKLFLPLNLEFQVSKDDPVRLLRHCIGGMDIKSLEETYQRIDRNLASPRQMLAILVYAGMNHIFSSRKIETACRRDINFMYLLEGKPAYNIQCGTDSEFITWASVGPQPTDTTTLIPFLQDMEKHLQRRYPNVVADAGYESEENYLSLETNGQRAFIKPSNYEKSKTRKWKKDIGRRENMTYLPEEDAYLCAQGRKLAAAKEFVRSSRTGFKRNITLYSSADCGNCPLKSQCIHGNHCKTPLEERTKHFEVSKQFLRQRQEDLERITSKEGVQLCINRSIQAEGAFAMMKADMNFRRFLSRGTANVLVEIMLLDGLQYSKAALQNPVRQSRPAPVPCE